MKADVSNYDANIAKARKTLDGFRQDNLTLGGIINQSTKSVVAAAAQYASFAAVIGTVAAGFSEAASRGIELSREAEGVSKAFERLNKPGLLDNLRQATHNTVSDLELMKQAVKFDNFNLSLEQMGTFLAFAQQQAKDTGQDVNYLVDSIVTGLGRKSLPILDNLGLSATDIKERMKQTGDMTQAVAQIIEERMSKAGDYVETASDRAAQAQVKLDNAMKELGDTMNSLTGAGATLWTDLKVGAIDLANTAIKPLIKLFNELAEYINGPSVESILTKGMTDVTDTVDDNGRLIRKDAISSIPEIVVSGTKPKKKTKKTGTTKTEVITQGDMNDLWLKMLGTADTLKTDDNRYFQSVHGLLGEKGRNAGMGSIVPDLSADIEKQQTLVDELREKWAKAGGELRDRYVAQIIQAEDKLRNLKDEQEVSTRNTPQFDAKQDISKQWKVGKNGQLVQQGKDLAEDGRNVAAEWQSAASAISAVGAAMSQIEDPAAKVMGTIAQAIATIALTFASSLKGTVTPWDWIAAAVSGTATMISTISAIHSATGYANGGIVGRAGGGFVPGNSMSGDNIMGMVDGVTPVGLNSGELVLNKAQQANLASALESNGPQNMRLEAVVTAEQIRFMLNSNGRRTGRGEYVTTNFR
jgi:hypothetical protein